MLITQSKKLVWERTRIQPVHPKMALLMSSLRIWQQSVTAFSISRNILVLAERITITLTVCLRKNSTCMGQAAPRALHVRRGLLTQAEKIGEPLPLPIHRPPDTRAVSRVRTGRPIGPLAMCRLRGQARGFFFTPSLKFAPTGIQTQDLGGAAGVTRPADLAPFGTVCLRHV